MNKMREPLFRYTTESCKLKSKGNKHLKNKKNQSINHVDGSITHNHKKARLIIQLQAMLC